MAPGDEAPGDEASGCEDMPPLARHSAALD